MIAICCMTSIAYAGQEIVGGLGVSLGDPVDESMVFIGEDKQGHQNYAFREGSTNEFFSDYWVKATHKTKVIFGIYADHRYNNWKDCEDRYLILETALNKKYDQDHNSTGWYYIKDDRRIRLACYDRNGTALLQLEYSDDLLKTKSLEEKAEEISDSL